MIDLKRIQNSIDYIENNLNEKIKLEHITDNAYISKYHYLRIFHSVVGVPIMEYIRKRRLSEAAKELKESNIKIVDIAFKYQFNSPEAFSRAFRAMFSVSPTAYRKMKPNDCTFERINVVVEMPVNKFKNNSLSMAA